MRKIVLIVTTIGLVATASVATASEHGPESQGLAQANGAAAAAVTAAQARAAQGAENGQGTANRPEVIGLDRAAQALEAVASKLLANTHAFGLGRGSAVVTALLGDGSPADLESHSVATLQMVAAYNELQAVNRPQGKGGDGDE